MCYNYVSGGKGAATPPPCKGGENVAYTEKKKQSNRKWDAANLERISFTVPKGCKAAVQAAADAAGESVNQYTQGALLARMGLQNWSEACKEQQE